MAIKQMEHMFLSLYVVLLLTVLTASSPVYNTSPVKDMAETGAPNSISDTLKSSFGKYDFQTVTSSRTKAATSWLKRNCSFLVNSSRKLER